MTNQPLRNTTTTAKQRLAASRLSLAIALHEPIWSRLARWCVKRYVIERPQTPAIKPQSDQAASGRTRV